MVYMLTFGDIWGILMGSMLPYIATPWILWVVLVHWNLTHRSGPITWQLPSSVAELMGFRAYLAKDAVGTGCRRGGRVWGSGACGASLLSLG